MRLALHRIQVLTLQYVQLRMVIVVNFNEILKYVSFIVAMGDLVNDVELKTDLQLLSKNFLDSDFCHLHTPVVLN